MTVSTIPQDRIRVFARDGSPLAEFRATVTRSYAIGDEGRAQFSYPTRKTDVVSKRVLNFGNWLLVENSVLPPWVGMIDTPRNWTSRMVTVCAYTPERQLMYRRGPLEMLVRGSAGDIFETLIQLTNAAEATVLRLGDIWRGGPTREETLNPTSLSESLRRIYERSLEEYSFRPVINARGYLEILCDWSQLLGQVTSVLLHEGKGGGNIEANTNILVEDGPIYNDILGYGDGETWKSKPNIGMAMDSSIQAYGVRQSSEEFIGVTSLETVKLNVQEKLDDQSETKNTFSINALNVGGTFQYLKLGNVFTVRFQNIGFFGNQIGYEGSVRLVGMHYDPTERNKMELVVQAL